MSPRWISNSTRRSSAYNKGFMKKLFYIVGIVFIVCLGGIGSLVRFDVPVEKLAKKYTGKNSKTVMVDGLRVYYSEEGQGFPVVLLHGFASSLQSWDGWARALSPYYKVIRLDLPGFGLTGPNLKNDYSVQWYADFLDKYLDSINVKECYLAGNSFGGRLACEFAFEKSPRVKKLVLVDAAGYPEKGKDLLSIKLAKTPWGRLLFRYITPRFLVAKNLQQAYASNPKMLTPELIDRFYDFIRREGNRDAFRAMSNMPKADMTSRIRSIKAPTLILWGDKDPDISVEFAHAFHRDIPGSREIIYKGIGHLPQEEIPDSSAHDVRDFF
jgi:pimeloyl-ACP methyl ester carboxylesterase